MELVFTETAEATERRRRIARGSFDTYRVRQTIEEVDQERIGGRWSVFNRVAPGTADDPLDDAVCLTPPTVHMIDTPGWFLLSPSQRTITIDGNASSPRATSIQVRQNFNTWVEGRTFLGDWLVASVRFPWQNAIRLDRASPTDDWTSNSNVTRIQSGHLFLTRPE